jgi:hypothetical protein
MGNIDGCGPCVIHGGRGLLHAAAMEGKNLARARLPWMRLQWRGRILRGRVIKSLRGHGGCPRWRGRGRRQGLRARGGKSRAGACVRGSRRPARDGGGSGRVGDGRTKIVDAYSKGLRNSRYLGRGVILTNDNLVKRGWKGSTKCSFCNQNKTIQRLFFDCYIARNIWRIINFALHIGRSSCINHLTRNWYISKKTTHRKRLLIGVASMFWSI